jgi:hypothetical protein
MEVDRWNLSRRLFLVYKTLPIISVLVRVKFLLNQLVHKYARLFASFYCSKFTLNDTENKTVIAPTYTIRSKKAKNSIPNKFKIPATLQKTTITNNTE